MANKKSPYEKGVSNPLVSSKKKKKPMGTFSPPIDPDTGKPVTGTAREKWERSIAGQLAEKRGNIAKKAVEKHRGRFSGVQSQEREDA
jgi:hypothetical protein